MRTLLKAFSALLCLVSSSAFGADISLATVNSTAGSTVTLAVPLRSSGAAVAGLQFDLQYNPAVLTGVVASLGSAASAAGKSLSVSSPSAGVTRVLIVGFNQTAIMDGPVATLSISIAANAGAGTYTLGLTGLSATDPNGATLALTATDGAVVIPGQTQTISFGALINKVLGTGTVSLTATATSGLTVSFASVTTAVCTVSGTTVTLVAVGTCTITASQAGNANFAAATPVSQSFIVTAPATQTITFAPLSTVTLDTAPFAVVATADSGLPVSITSSTLSICTVAGNTVTVLAVGNCILTATSAASSGYAAATPVTRNFGVIATPTCAYSLSGDTNLAAGGGSGTLQVATGASCTWTATSNAGFLIISSGASGTGPGTIGFSVSANTSASPRTATITAGAQTVTVTQFGTGCSFAISPQSLDVTSAGGSALVSIAASGSSCSWTGTSADAALTLSSAAGTAPSQVTVTVAANSGAGTRTLTATLGSQTLTVTQSGVNCTFTLGAGSATVSPAGGPGSVTLTTQPGCAYSTVTGPNWIRIVSGGLGSGSGMLFYFASPNATTSARSGTLTIGGQSFQINQAGLSCDISLDTSALASPFAAAGGTGALAVTTSSPGCTWSAASDAAWLTLAPSSGTGAGAVTVTAAANGSGVVRSARIASGGTSVTVTQAAPSCTYALRSGGGGVSAAGGAGTVNVITAPGCAWSATSNAAWLTIISSGSSGSGEVSFTAAANGSATPRSGTLTVAGQTFTVTQAGASCTFTLSLPGVDIAAAGAGGVFGINTSTVGCSVNAVSYAGWITVSTSFSGQNGTVTYVVAANTSGSARVGIVRAGSLLFTVTQAAAACSYTLSTPGAAFGSAGGSGTIAVTASSGGCTPTFSGAGATFVTLGSMSGPTGNVFTLPYTVASFSSAANAVRVGRVVFGGKTFVVKETSW